MQDQKIEVFAHAGHRGMERPKAFLFEGRRIELAGIVRMWVEEDHATREQKRFFIVEGSDQCVYTIYCAAGTDEWFMRRSEV
jgi:hypothetical protein